MTHSVNNQTHTIFHRIELSAPPEKVFDAVATPEGIAAWWTPQTSGGRKVGEILSVRFGDGAHGPDMRLDEINSPRQVVWTCVDGPWKGHHFSFSILETEGGSTLVFRHSGWSEQNDFFGHCNAKWGYFLVMSLKPYVESGKGAPHPADPSI